MSLRVVSNRRNTWPAPRDTQRSRNRSPKDIIISLLKKHTYFSSSIYFSEPGTHYEKNQFYQNSYKIFCKSWFFEESSCKFLVFSSLIEMWECEGLEYYANSNLKSNMKMKEKYLCLYRSSFCWKRVHKKGYLQKTCTSPCFLAILITALTIFTNILGVHRPIQVAKKSYEI